MKKTYFLFMLLAFPLTSMFGQELIGGLGGSRNPGLVSTTPVVLNESVDGSPYINEKYLPASVSASEGDVFYVRYNAMRDEFEVKGENNKAYSLNRYRRDIIVEILPLRKMYQVYGYFDDKQNENFGYFVYLTNSNAKSVLLKKERITFIGEKRAVTSYDTPRTARYKRWNDVFYIKLADDQKILKELPRSKRAIAKLFPEHKDTIFKYMKENRIKTTRESDLVVLLNYINTL